ncbi:hypothetical protein FCM35_KLT10948 [Carex littledalei]|uniref:Uncharacterized protein n=1 Tax=Carex littledalei TaxID=544730 RepID=A0A833V483_9POAL|nr:hypothetical protein FCM35_KLT10948 [Carex littledalei]
MWDLICSHGGVERSTGLRKRLASVTVVADKKAPWDFLFMRPAFRAKWIHMSATLLGELWQGFVTELLDSKHLQALEMFCPWVCLVVQCYEFILSDVTLS